MSAAGQTAVAFDNYFFILTSFPVLPLSILSSYHSLLPFLSLDSAEALGGRIETNEQPSPLIPERRSASAPGSASSTH